MKYELEKKISRRISELVNDYGYYGHKKGGVHGSMGELLSEFAEADCRRTVAMMVLNVHESDGRIDRDCRNWAKTVMPDYNRWDASLDDLHPALLDNVADWWWTKDVIERRNK